MRVKIHTSGLKATSWHQLLLRFVFGGLVTATAGLIAKIYGPAIGGLFLAFPAIFPATATLIEKHEREKKLKASVNGTVRARKAVAIDAAGASVGAIGLLAFAFVVQEPIVTHSPTLVIVAATFVWMLVSYLLWVIRKRL